MSVHTGATGATLSAIPRTGMHRVQVVGRAQAARDVVTLWLAAPGTLRAPAPYKPGQFVTLALATDRGPLYRSYSLCGDGSLDHPWEITVKRQHAGVVSSYIYDRVREGQILYVSAPTGAFTLPTPLSRRTPLVFVALGSGITPIYGMLRALAGVPAHQRPPVVLHYAYATPADAIYGRELAALDPQRAWLAQWHYISNQGSRLSVEQVLALSGQLTTAAEWYICGSAEFKRGLEAVLLRRGVPAAHVHAEMFSSPSPSASIAGASVGDAAAGRTTGTAALVRLADRGVTLDARPGETLLDILERHGYHPEFSCRAGACGTCTLHLLSGRVSQPADGPLSAQQRAAGYVLSCVTRPVGEVTLASAGGGAPGMAVAAGGRSPGRRAARRALRWAIAAAAVALFVKTWTVTSQFSLAQAANPDTSQPSNSATCSSSPSNDDTPNCAQPAPTATPSGPSSIFTPPSAPPPPSTSSGSSR